jgi:peptidoglycan/xylan/chitin deacetylase (PgdA/CDA1 family)
MALARDMVGYAKTPPVVEWPGGARIALSIVLNYEEGSELTPYYGDAVHETRGELVSNRPPNERDYQTETQWEYGSRAGAWRLLRILEERSIKATIYACGMALEQNPELGVEIAARGHDVCGHGYRWIPQWHLERQEEQESIRKTVAAIENTTGKRPYGWFTRSGPSQNTREILADEGFLYDCDGINDDLPYYASVQDRPWLVVPYALDSNDGKWWHQGWAQSDQFLQYLKDSFDMLYAEGASHPRMLSVGLHTRVSGRPGRAIALARFLDYALGHTDVWFAGRDDIARWWLEQYPAERLGWTPR